jgi:hypothetical protein
MLKSGATAETAPTTPVRKNRGLSAAGRRAIIEGDETPVGGRRAILGLRLF